METHRGIQSAEEHVEDEGARPPAVKPEDPPPPAETPEPPEEEWVDREVEVMGFKVQLFSTTSVDEAQKKKAKMLEMLESHYMESREIELDFDPPYYKLRCGNYLTKADAEKAKKQLKEIGIRDAWVVRDKVIQIVREKKE